MFSTLWRLALPVSIALCTPGSAFASDQIFENTTIPGSVTWSDGDVIIRGWCSLSAGSTTITVTDGNIRIEGVLVGSGANGATYSEHGHSCKPVVLPRSGGDGDDGKSLSLVTTRSENSSRGGDIINEGVIYLNGGNGGDGDDGDSACENSSTHCVLNNVQTGASAGHGGTGGWLYVNAAHDYNGVFGAVNANGGHGGISGNQGSMARLSTNAGAEPPGGYGGFGGTVVLSGQGTAYAGQIVANGGNGGRGGDASFDKANLVRHGGNAGVAGPGGTVLVSFPSISAGMYIIANGGDGDKGGTGSWSFGAQEACGVCASGADGGQGGIGGHGGQGGSVQLVGDLDAAPAVGTILAYGGHGGPGGDPGRAGTKDCVNPCESFLTSAEGATAGDGGCGGWVGIYSFAATAGILYVDCYGGNAGDGGNGGETVNCPPNTNISGRGGDGVIGGTGGCGGTVDALDASGLFTFNVNVCGGNGGHGGNGGSGCPFGQGATGGPVGATGLYYLNSSLQPLSCAPLVGENGNNGNSNCGG